MARQIGFHFYSLKIWQKYTSELEVLSALRGKQDALSLLRDGMNQIVDSQRDDQAARRMFCLRRVEQHGRHITGLIEAGGYGETANIVHRRTRRTYHQGTEEASMLPAFFRLSIPKGEQRGVLVLQRDNRVPAKQALAATLSTIIGKFDEHLTSGLTAIANKAVFDRMVKGGDVQEIRFIRLSIPQDFASGYDTGRDELKGTVELSYKASKGRKLPITNLLRSWTRGSDADALDQYEIPGMADFEFDTVKAALKVGKKVQTVDFGRRQTQPIVDVTDQVSFDVKSGHPTYESLLKVTAELIEDETFTAFGD